ncbi:ATP-binding cassette domain-containing protein [Corynebacterium sp. TAE3-ERU12]|uniref:methionine ABC transporter ATP-binding protein n=1 Tax=Corynebacterium sp. TAE3-ERU12 TaxID=2849491 RepID=UPI001C449256|nr:ATP-binding cassette domain-containing protein [Corynebacterium sp. TAE3-ERU12]MBV7294739.1 ATP-binding cassette domain-containing protein [Corynebacterium sp. TAE3-ERU12]
MASKPAQTAATGGTTVRFENVTKVFGSGKAATEAVNDVSLKVESGKILGVIGYSGAGKSTLIRLVNGLERASEGKILLDDTDIVGMSERQLRSIRREIGMIFQQFNLFSSRTVAGNVAYPLELTGASSKERKARVQELLEFVGLGNRGDAYPEQLSGGQKQRVGIARALATNPRLLLADEATSALDPETTAEVLALLRQVNRDLGVTIILITHEMSVVRAIADEVAVMDGGRVVEQGSVHDIFANPQTETARRFTATALRDRPEGRELDSARVNADKAALVTVRIDDTVPLTTLMGVAAEHGLDASVAHGSVTNVQAHAFGRLTLRLTNRNDEPADRGALDEVIAAWKQYTETEVLA